MTATSVRVGFDEDPGVARPPNQLRLCGSASTVIDATTVNNFWRSHAYNATVTEIACWTDAGTVSLTIKDSAGNAIASTLSCGTRGAANSTINGFGVITAGEGLGFATASVSSVKNVSVSIKYTRSY